MEAHPVSGIHLPFNLNFAIEHIFITLEVVAELTLTENLPGARHWAVCIVQSDLTHTDATQRGRYSHAQVRTRRPRQAPPRRGVRAPLSGGSASLRPILQDASFPPNLSISSQSACVGSSGSSSYEIRSSANREPGCLFFLSPA